MRPRQARDHDADQRQFVRGVLGGRVRDANPANSITTSEGIGMHTLEIAISAKMPGRPRFADEVGGFVDERFRDRCENEHGPANDTGIHGHARRAPAGVSVASLPRCASGST